MRSDRSRAFTLVELLVTVAVIAILASLVFAGLGSVRAQGDRTVAVANMRQIGSAIILYAGDNEGKLPGPLWPGQIPYLDPDRSGRLVRALDPYITGRSVPETGTVDVFVPPAFERVMGAEAVKVSRTFVMNMAVQNQDEIVNPWTSAVDPEAPEPMRLGSLPGSAWGFSDADQLHPRVAPAPWSGATPETIIHGKDRLAWFFAGHVRSIEEEELVAP